MLNHPTGLFRETIIRPFGGAGPSNFYTPYNSLKCISSRTWGAGRPHVGLCHIFLVFINLWWFAYLFIFSPIPVMGHHFTLGAGPAQIMGQHVLPQLYGCRRLWVWRYVAKRCVLKQKLLLRAYRKLYIREIDWCHYQNEYLHLC